MSTGMAVTYPEGSGEATDRGTKLAAGCRARLQARKEDRLNTFRQRLGWLRSLRYYKVEGTPLPHEEPIIRQNVLLEGLWPHPHPFPPILGEDQRSCQREGRGREGRSTLKRAKQAPGSRLSPRVL